MAFRHSQSSTGFSRRRVLHALAVALMLVQVAAGPLHVSPGLAAAGASSAASLAGFLEICTARGLVRLVAGESPSERPNPGDRSAPSCPVCMAMGAAHAFGPSEGPVMPVLSEWVVGEVPSAYREIRAAVVATAHPPRAPPSVT